MVSVAAMIPFPIHAMVTHEYQKRVIVKCVDDATKNVIHLRQLRLHARVVGSDPMTDMVHA